MQKRGTEMGKSYSKPNGTKLIRRQFILIKYGLYKCVIGLPVLQRDAIVGLTVFTPTPEGVGTVNDPI